MTLEQQIKAAKKAALGIAASAEEVRNRALQAVAAGLRENREAILAANRRDCAEAEKQDLPEALKKRLALSEAKIEQMARGVESVAALEDPLGRISLHRELDGGLVLERRSVPIGLIGVIFESRPDALVQIASLCIKSGNALILKGGSEAAGSNQILHRTIVEALDSVDAVFKGTLLLLETREEIQSVLGFDQYIDLLIPRGSNALVRYIMENTRIPVLGHADGICHMYLHKACDPELALELVWDSKCQYPAVCNAIETLLVHRDSLGLLPALADRLAGVELRGDEEVCNLLDCAAATEEDWRTEYNELILSVKSVGSLDEALEHINTYGSRHTEAIVTGDEAAARRFMAGVDASSVMWNASTRFADGFRYGFGAEVGISTSKIHARGPVGLEGLTTVKYQLVGGGHCVKPYADGEKEFRHRDLG